MPRAVDFMKPRVGLIFTVTDNCLIFLLSIHNQKSCYTRYTINSSGKSDKNDNEKEADRHLMNIKGTLMQI